MEEYVYEEKKIGKYLVQVIQDKFPNNPRINWDHLGTMICFHKNYRLGDEHNFDIDSIQEYVKQKNVYSLPLYLYDHSGVTMNTQGFSCRWDSGQVGFIYITREKYLKEFNCKRVNKKHIYKILTAEVKEYDQYLTGEVYGYKIINTENDDCIDSCYGFYEEVDYCLSEGISIAEWNIENDKRIENEKRIKAIKEHIQKVKVWIIKKVNPDKRYNCPILK
jgi:hypothetical protein